MRQRHTASLHLPSSTRQPLVLIGLCAGTQRLRRRLSRPECRCPGQRQKHPACTWWDPARLGCAAASSTGCAVMQVSSPSLPAGPQHTLLWVPWLGPESAWFVSVWGASAGLMTLDPTWATWATSGPMHMAVKSRASTRCPDRQHTSPGMGRGGRQRRAFQELEPIESSECEDEDSDAWETASDEDSGPEAESDAEPGAEPEPQPCSALVVCPEPTEPATEPATDLPRSLSQSLSLSPAAAPVIQNTDQARMAYCPPSLHSRVCSR